MNAMTRSAPCGVSSRRVSGVPEWEVRVTDLGLHRGGCDVLRRIEVPTRGRDCCLSTIRMSPDSWVNESRYRQMLLRRTGCNENIAIGSCGNPGGKIKMDVPWS